MTASDFRSAPAGSGLARTLFVIGMMLMPISTGARRGVFAFGLPFLAMLSVLYVMLQLANPVMEKRQRRIALYAFLLISAIGITTIYAIAPFASFSRLMPNVFGFFLFLMLISPFFGEQGAHFTYEFTAKVYIASAGLVAFYYLANFAFAVATIGIAAVFLDRVTGGVISLPWGATNVVASALLFPLFLTFYFANRDTSRAGRYMYLVARVLMLGAIAATVSRGAVLSTGFGMIMLAFFLRGKAREKLVIFILVAAAVTYYVNLKINEVMSEQVVSALVNRFQDSDMKDLNGRLMIWSKFGSAFIQSPIFGIGYYSSLYYFQTSGHNLFLTSLVERGVIGFALSAALPLKAAKTLAYGLADATDARLRLIFSCMTAGALASGLHLMIEDANFTQQYIVYSWVAFALVFQAAEVVRRHTNIRVPAPAALPLSFQS